MYTQATFAVVNEASFGAVHAAIAASFSASKVEGFLKSVNRAKLRIRNFDGVVERGLLGAGVAENYKLLQTSDQSMIREFYLASLERVAPALRKKFLKVYAYY